MKCPCCHQPLPESLDPVELHHLSGMVKLTPSQRTVLEALILRSGRFVSRAALHDELWPNPDLEPETSSNIVRVYVTIIRKVIRPLGWMIIHDNRLGYRIALLDPKPKSRSSATREEAL